MPPMDAVTLLDRRLEWLRSSRPDLAEIVDLQGALIRETLRGTRPPVARSFGLSRDRALGKLREGTPLLHGEPVFLDVEHAADLFERLLDVVLQRVTDDALARAQTVARALLSDAVVPHQLVEEAFVRHGDHLVELATAAGADPEILANLAAIAVRPLLLAYAGRLADSLGDGSVWRKGYCPVCGAWAQLGEVVAGQRHLRCVACGTGWPVRAVFCPFCENADARRTRVLNVEGEPRFRIEACERCTGYLKTATALGPTPPELLAFDDLATVRLDVAASDKGLRRPSTQGYHIELAVDESEWSEDILTLE